MYLRKKNVWERRADIVPYNNGNLIQQLNILLTPRKTYTVIRMGSNSGYDFEWHNPNEFVAAWRHLRPQSC